MKYRGKGSTDDGRVELENRGPCWLGVEGECSLSSNSRASFDVKGKLLLSTGEAGAMHDS